MRRSITSALMLAALAAPALAQTPPAGEPLINPRGALEPSFAEDEALKAAIDGPSRTAAERARDAYRHPYEALTFWGLRPGLTVVEIEPGAGGWWTHILAPYAQATSGRYVAAQVDLGAPQVSDRSRQARTALETSLAANPSASAINFGATSGLGAPDASADLILVARAFHNWSQQEGLVARYMGEFARVLKPGGVLAVEQHRSAEGLNVADTATTGYVPESYVIRAAQEAGLVLDARSELNANPKDDHDHPFGVWTLPPVRASEQDGRTLTAQERAAFDAIGESDRMTLRFRKPEA